MAYTDGFYYVTSYYGKDIPTTTQEDRAELERLIARASEKIDEATYNRSRDWDRLSEYEQEMVKKAVCAEAEALYSYGEDAAGAAATMAAGEISGYTIGDVHVSFATGGSSSSSTSVTASSLGLLSEKAAKYLNNTRLISRIL